MRGSWGLKGTDRYPQGLMVGLDVGSTTLKAVVVDPVPDAVLWRDYQRHGTRPFETCLSFLTRIERAFADVPRHAFRVFATGSGGAAVGAYFGARAGHEVHAVSLAVEKYYADAQSVIELGGQDAKIIVLKTDPRTGRKTKFATMNDKCAGGTGVVIDRIAAKLAVSADDLSRMGYTGVPLHPVAGKCGVFAETDVNSLHKRGVPAAELIASLFEAVVVQNLSVLTRGHTLFPKVLLLGGPNAFLRGLKECWRHHIAALWAERNVGAPTGRSASDLVVVPENALYFGALGMVELGKAAVEDNPGAGLYEGSDRLRAYIEAGRVRAWRAPRRRGLVASEMEARAFEARYAPGPWAPATLAAGRAVGAFVGLDGGSTSTKAVLLNRQGNVIAKGYRLSRGNPIEDTREVLGALREQVEGQGCRLDVLGVGTTGYAKDLLGDVIGADVALVETVAHMRSALRYHPRADVICDVGGQDIKVILLKDGAVKDFRLNTQCSAGNGYYLQATAEAFGYDLTEYGDAAFRARAMPEFSYGCAVFMQSDVVGFQRQGWRPEEILAGLAAVLPKNIWLYVCRAPDLAQLGRTFVLQGGTQRNLAAVKAQVDFIQEAFAGAGIAPEIVVHRHCGEAGAIGCALEARRLYMEEGRRTSFIGFDAVGSLDYTTLRDETTRCRFCKNRCPRTFIDIRTDDHAASRRLIVANCEMGAAEDVGNMRVVEKRLESVRRRNPDLAAVAAREVFDPAPVADVADPPAQPRWFMAPRTRQAVRRRREWMAQRQQVRIGLPRVAGFYGLAPFFMGYFQSLGVPGENLVWSDYTSARLYREGANRGSIDPCYPSKLAIPHVHNLLYRKHCAARPLTHIFLPMVDSMPTWLEGVQASRCCPTAAMTPEAVYAAFTKESDLFAERGIRFKKTFVNLDEPALCGRQMYEDWAEEIGVSERESTRAVLAGLTALSNYLAALRRKGRAVLERLRRENRIGLVLLARPYHNDPGINHGLAEAFQGLGYPVLTVDSLPLDADILEGLFGEELARGELAHPLSIDDVWKNSYAEHGSRKVWAAKYVARHPNLVGLELSSFKCGHDAPIYSTIEDIIEASGTPFFSFRELDENKPDGTFKVRIETISYFLARYVEGLQQETAEAPARRDEGVAPDDEAAA